MPTLTERLDDAVDSLDDVTDWELDADERAVRFRTRTRPTAATARRLRDADVTGLNFDAPVRRVPSSLAFAGGDGGDRTWSLVVDLSESETTA